MTALTQPLRDEHRELIAHIENIRAVADLVGEAPIESTREAANEVHAFLTGHLIPHAEAEDRALYPVVQKIMGAPLATATMSRDHIEVGRLTQELGSLAAKPDASAAKELRRVLYGLYALIRVHFAKEEEIYLPLLDEHLTEAEARSVFRAMGHPDEHPA